MRRRRQRGAVLMQTVALMRPLLAIAAPPVVNQGCRASRPRTARWGGWGGVHGVGLVKRPKFAQGEGAPATSTRMASNKINTSTGAAGRWQYNVSLTANGKQAAAKTAQRCPGAGAWCSAKLQAQA